MRCWIFYYLADFSKKAVFSRKRQKTVPITQVSFERKEASGHKNEYNLFIENELLNTFSSNNFFEKCNIFGENKEKNFERHYHFLGEGVILR